MENREEQQEWRKDERKRVIAGILLVGILATALAGCKNADVTKKKEKSPLSPWAVTVIRHTII